ncbi:MAG: M20/M25/M40 family metallo-hydrolase [Chloroflexota bacterium]
MRIQGPTRARDPRLAANTARAAVLGSVLALVVAACGEPAPPTPPLPDSRTVAAAVTEDGLRARLQALAVATEGSEQYRAVGSAGYERAAALVEQELRAAGWTVTEDAYTGAAFTDEGGSFLEVGGRTFGVDDLRPLIFAPAGDVEGRVITIDWDPDAIERTGKGCAVTHYGDLPEGAIVVVRSGDCLRREQVIAAQQAGAAAFVAVYPGAPAGIVYRPTLIEPRFMAIPAAAVSREAAEALVNAAATGGTARLVTHARTSAAPTRSILAELPGTEPGAVIMLGAHLDSVIDGPGINDDGSGVAALLEIARALAGTRPRATIRLAFWSGEEVGLHGSVRYALALSTEDARAILVYVNVDMIASPNGFAGVYDEPGAPAGSAAARALLTSAVERAGGAPVGIDLGGGSDHYGFAQAGVATAGVHSGGSDPVTAEQGAASGAVVGRPADACYHQPCDDLENANLALARVLAAGLADFAVRVANNPELLER